MTIWWTLLDVVGAGCLAAVLAYIVAHLSGRSKLVVGTAFVLVAVTWVSLRAVLRVLDR